MSDHHFRVISDGPSKTRVEMDGAELQGVTGLTYSVEAGGYPATIALTLMPGSVEIEGKVELVIRGSSVVPSVRVDVPTPPMSPSEAQDLVQQLMPALIREMTRQGYRIPR